MGRHDCIIVAGDFGGVMTGTPSEEHWLNWLEDQPFTSLFVDGNHENFDRLNSMPIHRWHGGSVHFVRSHVIHLMRGQGKEKRGNHLPRFSLPCITVSA
jgi:predicted phosphohydrolase